MGHIACEPEELIDDAVIIFCSIVDIDYIVYV